jgi:CubicO group peptidase (beta-lactamase class C family)
MDEFLDHIEKNIQGMGSLSIFRDGEEVYQKAYGYADVAKKTRADAETKYRIGSISKTFTATIIMQLVSEGKLSLDAPLSGFYPEIGNSDKISIEHLLRHRSGIYNFTSAEDYKSWEQTPMTREDMVAKIVANGNVFAPGEKAEYSNANYVLLSFIAEKSEKKEFADILRERICEPCAIRHTYYGSKISGERNEARSYTRKGKEWIISTETDMSIPSGAGAIVSTPSDLNVFLNCLFKGDLASTVSLETMMELQDGFGMGMFVAPFYDKKAYGHTGGIDGFQSNAFLFPEENVSVAYTTNAASMAVNNILIGVLSIYFGKDYEFPVFTEPIEVSPAELDKYPGIYSAPSFPLKITITRKEGVLMAQATGQASFPLEAYEKDKFRFEAAQIIMEFLPEENKMVFRQGARQFEMTRE